MNFFCAPLSIVKVFVHLYIVNLENCFTRILALKANRRAVLKLIPLEREAELIIAVFLAFQLP